MTDKINYARKECATASACSAKHKFQTLLDYSETRKQLSVRPAVAQKHHLLNTNNSYDFEIKIYLSLPMLVTHAGLSSEGDSLS